MNEKACFVEDSLRTWTSRTIESSCSITTTRIKTQKLWLLEDATIDHEGVFTNRNSPFQSSLNDQKTRRKQQKPGLFKGIGHIIRFGKHCKDGVD
uniref:CSON007123 protein n=1 Tax=Culicoides sonorensis TaxID=179676 RepID=A0A336MUJ2_CULSO